MLNRTQSPVLVLGLGEPGELVRTGPNREAKMRRKQALHVVKTGCNGPYLDAIGSADLVTCGLSVVKGSRLCPNIYVRLFFNDLIVQVGEARDILITWFESGVGCGRDHV